MLECETTLLGKRVRVQIDDGLSDKRQNQLKAQLDAALKNINGHAGSLTKAQADVLSNPKTIDINSSAKRSYTIESKGAFTLT